MSEAAGAFLNGPGAGHRSSATNLPHGGPAYPLAAPGARLAYSPNDSWAS